MPYVSVIYDDGVNPFEGSFELNEILLSDLVVTKPPNRTSYIEGEEISYDGMVVMATFSDDTTEDVTNKCVITPPEGSVFEGSTYAEMVVA